MEDVTALFFARLRWLVFLLLVGWVVACRTTSEVAPILDLRVISPPQASIVSVLPVRSDAAELQIKDTPGLTTPYEITWQAPSGSALVLTAVTDGTTSQPDHSFFLSPTFHLARYRITGLTIGQTYRFQLHFRYNNEDTLTVERRYTHRAAANWTQLAHLPVDNGQFTGTPNELDTERQGELVSLLRYADESTTQPLLYNRFYNAWQLEQLPPALPVPRLGMIQFNLYYLNIDRYRFWGLGFQTSDLFPGKYVYLRDMYLTTPPPYNALNVVLPSYLGEVGETAFFRTTDQAFFLNQNGSSSLFIIDALGKQRAGSSLPEATGTLATFTIDSVGYVVNQVDNAAPRLWAYNTRTDRWTRKADFPGSVRSRGVGFSIDGKGYFGLGISPEQTIGYRDIWRYDPLTNHWQYVTDYPGQGNRYVSVLSLPKRVYLGFGYETQPVVSQEPSTRQVGCTDFWEFVP